LPTGFAADDINGLATSDLIEPSGENGVRRETTRLSCELDEDRLHNFLGELWRANLAERGGMNQVEMTANEFREGVLGVVPGIACEEILIRVAHFQKDNAADDRNPTGNFTWASFVLGFWTHWNSTRRNFSIEAGKV
jgi:hypothetical protein